ncbi:hypothetical protein [Neisseria sp.]
MENQNFDLDELDDLLSAFDNQTVEGGVDADAGDDGCEGGACKI